LTSPFASEDRSANAWKKPSGRSANSITAGSTPQSARAFFAVPALVKLSDIANEFVGTPGTGREGIASSYLAPAAGYLAGHFIGGPLGGLAGHLAAHRVAHAAVNAMSCPRPTRGAN